MSCVPRHSVCDVCVVLWQAGELKERDWLSEKESQALDYLHLLESYHPLQSYEEAQTIQSQHKTRYQMGMDRGKRKS